MDKQNPLLPFAFSTSSITDEVPLNTAPRNRLIIDENASSMYHTIKILTSHNVGTNLIGGPKLET